jgi:hypothetical protein
MKALVGLCTVLYKSFPTSIQEDTKLLAALEADGSSAAEGVRLAVAYRLAAKRGLEGSTKKILVRMKELVG